MVPIARALIALLLVVLLEGAGNLTGGTILSNSASATFVDIHGRAHDTTSNRVSVAIASIGSLTVTPKETAANPVSDGAPVGQNVTRSFVITNTGNFTDTYTIESLSVAPLTVVSMAYVTPSSSVPATLGSGASPPVAPGQSITLQIVLGTSILKIGQSVSVTVNVSTASTSDNGVQSDYGEAWVIGAVGAVLSGPGGTGTLVQKTVNHLTFDQSAPGSMVPFDIVVENSGGTPANNVVMTDVMPTGLTPQPSTVKIDGVPAASSATLSGQTLTVQCGTLNVGATMDISFEAQLPGSLNLGTSFVNVAQVSASNASTQKTTLASVLDGVANVVYDAQGGQSQPVAGATLSLLNANLTPVTFKASEATPQATSSPAQNPVVTGASGTYVFPLAPSRISAGGTQFYLTAGAAGYLNRKIGLEIAPAADGVLFDVTATALDSQPIAVAGGYALTSHSVELKNVLGLFGNIPLFSNRAISVTKTADRSVAQPGDRVAYTIDYSTSTSTPVGDVTVVDTLPAGLSYAIGTARIDGAHLEPVVTGRQLTWHVPPLQPGAQYQLTYFAVVYPSDPAGMELTNRVTVAGQITATSASVTGSAIASIQVVSGGFTQLTPITGRVFLDLARTGHFARDDKGISGVRVFMEDGSFVTTDMDGRFTFSGARPGVHVLRLDTATLPRGARPYQVRRSNSTRSMQQLVHGILDDGVIDDVEFALDQDLSK